MLLGLTCYYCRLKFFYMEGRSCKTSRLCMQSTSVAEVMRSCSVLTDRAKHHSGIGMHPELRESRYNVNTKKSRHSMSL